MDGICFNLREQPEQLKTKQIQKPPELISGDLVSDELNNMTAKMISSQ
jgi:hypothetical protein